MSGCSETFSLEEQTDRWTLLRAAPASLTWPDEGRRAGIRKLSPMETALLLSGVYVLGEDL